MERNSDCARTYRQVTVNTAHPGKIIVMLYDEALKQLDTAIQKLEAKTKALDAVNKAILKAYDIITELMVSLDMERGGEIAQQLYNLYTFFNAQLIQGNIKKNVSILRNVYTLIAELRESWRKISHTLAHHNTNQLSAVDING